MHALIPLQPSTLPQASRLIERIADLGGVSQYPCLLVCAGELDLAPLHKLAASAFQSVSVFPVEMPDGHPNPANLLFQRAAQHMGMQVGDSYLYLEPDSWPTSSHWLKDLVSAYREYNAKFMGKLAMLPDGSGEQYMLATGFYPKDFYLKSDLIRQIPLDKSAAEFLQGEIVYRGKAHDSGLFCLYGDDDRNASLVLNRPSEEELSLRKSCAAAAINVSSQFGITLDIDKTEQLPGDWKEIEPSPDAPLGGLSYKPLPGEVVYNSGGTLESIARPVIELFPTKPDAKLSSEVVTLDESWVNDPRALDPGVPIAAAVIPEAMQESGTLDPFPQPAEPALVFATEEERNQAIKKSQAEGMGWKTLLSTYKMSPVAMKKILNGVG